MTATKGVIILAATNRPESLDPALLRPGRFDRRVPVELPDLKGREDILRVHAAKVRHAPNLDFSAIARAAAGASGAELANIVNEAALRAVRQGRSEVIQSDMEESVEVVIAGYQKKNQILSDKEKLIVAYHETGHALVAALQSHSAPVHKITIIPRTSGALGYTMQVDEGDHYLMSKEELENRISTLTGGRVAEDLVFHSITTGAANDIEQATKLARAMLAQYGMSEEFGMVALQTQSNLYLGGDASPRLLAGDRGGDRPQGHRARAPAVRKGAEPPARKHAPPASARPSSSTKRKPSPARNSWRSSTSRFPSSRRRKPDPKKKRSPQALREPLFC